MDECRPSPRGHRQHRVTQRQANNQASDEQGLLGKSAMQVPEYDHQYKKRRSNGRVAGDGDRYAATVSDDVDVMSIERRSPRFVDRQGRNIGTMQRVKCNEHGSETDR